MSARPTPADQGLERATGLTVNVEGYLSTCAGQGAAARLYIDALRAAGVDVTATNVEIGEFLPGASLPQIPERDRIELRAASPPDVNLLCINGLELEPFTAVRGESYFTDRPSVGVWAWETDVVPDPMRSAAGLLREIWVYSEWLASILGPVVETPVAAVAPPVTPPRAVGRLDLDLAEGFLFLYVFDLLSSVPRKNPLGLITAFRRAFGDGEGPVLVLKTMNGDLAPESLQRLGEAVGDRSDITLIDRQLDESEKAALFARADCYVSLHRSEGFGITAAEAMLQGKPVIATGYSGTRDFMTPENSFLVDYRIVEIGPGNEFYSAAGHWADPDLDHAATLMREVWESPEEARRRGELGRTTVETTLSPSAIGERARRRLTAVAA